MQVPIADPGSPTVTPPEQPPASGSAPTRDDRSGPTEAKPASPDRGEATDQELMDDLRKILEDGFEEPAKPAKSDPGAPKRAEPESPPAGPSAAAKQAANRTRIFDELAASMSHAKSYDLGSVALDHRFDEFDHDADRVAQQATAPADRSGTTAAAALPPPPPPPPPPAREASTKEFVEDLDLINGASRSQSDTSDIPLDPGVGGRSIDARALEPGDVILSTTSHPISEAIRKVTGSEVSHSALYVGNGRVIEAIEEGVIIRSLDTSLADDSLAVAYRHRDMTPVKAQAVIAFAEDHARKKTPFDNWGLIQVAPGQLARAICNQKEGAERETCLANAPALRVGTNDDGAFFCSELVLEAFQHADLALTDTEPSWSSPGQIVELHHNGLFDYVGHLVA